MFKSIPLISNQKDLIHDISFDYYGTRIATSSNDHSINVWDLNDKGTWYCSSNWKAHNGPVWRVIWAHPEFGQVLASCSFDRTVAIWEETTNKKVSHGSSNKSSISHTWCKRASLVDSRASVTSIAFAPHAGINTILDLSASNRNPGIDLGLTLVTASADGMIRFYEAPDVVNLSQWSLSYEMTTYPSTNIAGKEVATRVTQTAMELNLTWSTSKIFLPLLAVGIDGSNDPNCYSKGKIQIYQYADNGKKWSLIEEQLAGIAEPVKDIKFAPDVGLSYHVLACTTANVAFIFALKPSESGSSTNNPTNNDPINCYKRASLDIVSFLETSATFLPISTPHHKLYQMAQLSAPGHTIWRLSWNITGNVLATSGQDGVVRLWKANFLGQWKCSVALKNDGMVVNGVIPSTGEIDDFKELRQNYAGLESTQKTTPHDHKQGKLGGATRTLDSASQVVWH